MKRSNREAATIRRIGKTASRLLPPSRHYVIRKKCSNLGARLLSGTPSSLRARASSQQPIGGRKLHRYPPRKKVEPEPRPRDPFDGLFVHDRPQTDHRRSVGSSRFGAAGRGEPLGSDATPRQLEQFLQLLPPDGREQDAHPRLSPVAIPD